MDSVIAIVLTAIAVYLVIKVLTAPIRWVWKILMNIICGAVMLTLANMLSSYTGLVVDITVLRCFLVGLLGLPGFIGIVLWELFM